VRRPRHPGSARPGVPGRVYSDRVTELRFTHEPDASRYTLHRGDDLVSVLDYRDDGRTVAMTRAYTVPSFRGHGYAGELVDRAVAELERSGGRRVIPVCWYVEDWFTANPGRGQILADRRSA
jgi:predicted GNAT family acetyltransferase